MTKRGQLFLIAIITMVVAAAIGVTYPRIAKAYTTGAISLKISAARDIALTIDTIYAYPYDMELEYGLDLSKYIVEISGDSVRIYDKSFVRLSGNKVQGIDPKFAQYSFVPGNENLNFLLDGPKLIIFSKTDGKLNIIKNENI